MVHSTLKKYITLVKPGSLDYEDLFQIAMIGVFKALSTFDDEKNIALSTYVVTCIRNQVLYETRKNRAKSRTAVNISYESEMFTKDGHPVQSIINKDLRNCDGLHNHGETMEESVETMDDYRTVVGIMQKYLSNIEREMIQLNADGCTQAEIARKIGLTQAQVSRTLKITKSKIILHMRRLNS